MAAPTGTVWGNTVTGSKSTRKGKIGIYKGVTETATQVKVNIQVWFWSMYGLSDSNNSYYYNSASTATTLIGAVNINHTVSSGDGWSTSNQTKLGESTYTYDKGTSASTKYYSAKLTDVDSVGGSNVMSVSTSYVVPALASYKVSYNANGGSGAPSAQTKWYGKSLTLSSTKPSRTGYTFQGWATSAGGSVINQPGGTYTGNAAVTYYAIWKANTFTVSYNANGGTGAPANQTKTYGVNLKLSTVIPTRTNYTFKGWAVRIADGVSYNPGGTYAGNADLTLYAIWTLAYVKPRILSLSVNRCASNGTLSDDGTYALVSFDWVSDITISSLNLEWKLPTSSSWTTGSSLKPETTGGHVSQIIGNGQMDPEFTYNIQVVATDSKGSTTATAFLSGMKFIIDIKAEGKGISFGKPAELEDTADFGWDAKFNKPVYGKALGMDRVTEIPAGAKLNDYVDPGCFAIYLNADAATIYCAEGVLMGSSTEVPQATAGRLEVWASTGSGIHPDTYSYIRQRFIPHNYIYPVWERDVTYDPSRGWVYNGWWKSSLTPNAAKKVYGEPVTLFSGSSVGTITLSQDPSNFEYLEIFFTDNNGESGGYTKLHKPYTAVIDLAIIEAGNVSDTLANTYIRRTSYTISGTSMTPDITKAGYVQLSGTASSHKVGTNYIKITRVLGRNS